MKSIADIKVEGRLAAFQAYLDALLEQKSGKLLSRKTIGENLFSLWKLIGGTQGEIKTLTFEVKIAIFFG